MAAGGIGASGSKTVDLFFPSPLKPAGATIECTTENPPFCNLCIVCLSLFLLLLHVAVVSYSSSLPASAPWSMNSSIEERERVRALMSLRSEPFSNDAQSLLPSSEARRGRVKVLMNQRVDARAYSDGKDERQQFTPQLPLCRVPTVGLPLSNVKHISSIPVALIYKPFTLSPLAIRCGSASWTRDDWPGPSVR
ncbi:usherin [Anopheles sinensis]|uniref:Usherin n=1 Tax=Anopheles sinensis TaxID=74873 RepID=A0A084VUJ7_ANOSI|nr:usherin [Anopheles sinensis]